MIPAAQTSGVSLQKIATVAQALTLLRTAAANNERSPGGVLPRKRLAKGAILPSLKKTAGIGSPTLGEYVRSALNHGVRGAALGGAAGAAHGGLQAMGPQGRTAVGAGAKAALGLGLSHALGLGGIPGILLGAKSTAGAMKKLRGAFKPETVAEMRRRASVHAATGAGVGGLLGGLVGVGRVALRPRGAVASAPRSAVAQEIKAAASSVKASAKSATGKSWDTAKAVAPWAGAAAGAGLAGWLYARSQRKRKDQRSKE